MIFFRAQITGASSQEAVLLPEEDLGLPVEMPVLEEREKTPVSVSIPIPSPPPGEEEKTGVEPRKERAVREWSPDLEVCCVRSLSSSCNDLTHLSSRPVCPSVSLLNPLESGGRGGDSCSSLMKTHRSLKRKWGPGLKTRRQRPGLW